VAEAYRLPALKKTPISHVGKENPNPNRDRYPNRKIMALGHEKLDVYRLAISYVAWVFEHSEKLNGAHRHARDQWLRASQSIPLNIAEGNGKTTEADRRRYFEIARGSVLECAAIQDVLVVGKGLAEDESRERKIELDRMAAMLSRLGKRGYSVQEEPSDYRTDFDSDFDSDFDPEKTHSQQSGTGQPATRPESKSEGGDKPQSEAEGRSQ
jgi:four helix bundle protein